MLQGAMNAPGTFIRIMSDLFADYLGQFMWVYIEHILIYSNREQDHLKHMVMVGDKLKQAQFYASRKKSEFFAASIDVLGHIIDDEGLRASLEKIARIDAWTTPIGTRSNYRNFSELSIRLAILFHTWGRSPHA